LWLEFQESGVVVPGNSEKSLAALIYGQMTERPELAARRPDGCDSGGIFPRQEHLDVLLFIDNISALCRRARSFGVARTHASAVVQPNLNTESANCRSDHSTKHGSITSVQAFTCLPMTTRTPRRPATFTHLDATTKPEPPDRGTCIYPAVDPLASFSRILDPRVVGQEITTVARALNRCCALLGFAGQSSRFWASRNFLTKTAHVARARRIEKFLSQPMYVAAQFTASKVSTSRSRIRCASFKEIVEGKYDDIPEQAFYMVGTIDEVLDKGR